MAVLPSVGASAQPGTDGLSASPQRGDTISVAKSATSRLAQSDADLLASTEVDRVGVVVKLDYDSLATYAGDVPGYAATRPAARGEFDRTSPDAGRYETYVAGIEDAFLGALRNTVPGASVGTRLRTVFGGIALTLPENRAKDLLGLPGVVAVQRDELAQPLTDSSPEFIGATTLYAALGSDTTAGEGVIVGVLDTGSWPEHPSYVDPGIAAPPPRADGQPRVCDFGDNPLTPETDVFVCNDKLIAGEPFIDAYNATYPGLETYPDSARDSEGHGTHTSTTAAGATTEAVVLGIDRGQIHGIAPGAHIAMYKVCGTNGCFSSDSAAAVGQSIEDGVDVINFSISGGSDPYSDPVELAFLDAYTAGVFVSASAGNSGPGAGTVDHNGPWLTTVAASTQSRAFESTLTVTGGGDTYTVNGASITQGAGPAPVVLSSEAPGYENLLCDQPAEPGTLTGLIVACQRGVVARVDKGYNVMLGGAVGMVLYNPTLADVETDNHWLPTVHLADGTEFVAFVQAHPDATASFTEGQKVFGQGDVMAAFSSRGPGGVFLKPDVTAPGVQILAGHTPTPDTTTEGPPGQYFQAIAGTSMSSPHVAGSGALLFALHPEWSPGQVKSALMTTATTSVVKEDLVTPADPFDFGAGRIDLTRAGDPGLVFSQDPRGFYQAERFPNSKVDLNVPSVNVPALSGIAQTFRTATNVSDETLTYTTSATSTGGTVRVEPASFTVAPGHSVQIRIRINAPDLEPGQYFGQVMLTDTTGDRDVHLPVAFERTGATVAVSTECTPDTFAVGDSSTCAVTATNTSFDTLGVNAVSTVSEELEVTSAEGANQTNRRTVRAPHTTLEGGTLGVPSVDPGSLFGYLALADFGIAPQPIGDEEAINYGVDPFVYAGETYDTLGVTSNGYAVVGGAGSADVQFQPQTLPDPAAPNNVLAPYWTDLDGSEAPGIYAGLISDSTTGDQWFVIEWQENLYGTQDTQVFQLWIGLNGTEDITYAYDPANLPVDPPAGAGLTVGAENANGTGGESTSTAPTQDLRVTSTSGTPGGSLSYSFTVRGVAPGQAEVATGVASPLLSDLTTVVRKVLVTEG